METSKENNRPLTFLNDKRLERMKVRCILAIYLMSPLSKITIHEHTSHFKPITDSDSNRVNDLLINKTIPVTLYNKMLTFQDRD